jgi:hypothetical protein
MDENHRRNVDLRHVAGQVVAFDDHRRIAFRINSGVQDFDLERRRHIVGKMLAGRGGSRFLPAKIVWLAGTTPP